MHIDLSGKTAIVTGSSQGIGFATALGLARAGARTVITGRDGARLEKALRRIADDIPGADIVAVAADLSTGEGAETLLAEVPATDILVNNLGIFEPKPFLEIDDDEWRRYFDVNVLSGIRLSRLYLPGMIGRRWGRIVFVSSESALQIPPEMMHYGMTKTAQLAVARGLAEVCAGTAVTVNSVLPGPTNSEGIADFVAELGTGTSRSIDEQVDEFVREHRPTSLLRRAATTEEVANLIIYLSSPQASATTGAALSVDGGTRRSVV
ncbi:SDR family NAD(P)-dependent oxidoreductase [Streptomyces sp. AF1A]|jgi:NAD(P)-dependent dehydrogenase (short-subunit alcohol dehydrogenase family)|uniref:SDR family NAD(P)-dependent oxidoreductase n=1 Tax=Streptomyces sp. AF1A TaxID=3394350 RepID=UPI0039BD8307